LIWLAKAPEGQYDFDDHPGNAVAEDGGVVGGFRHGEIPRENAVAASRDSPADGYVNSDWPMAE